MQDFFNGIAEVLEVDPAIVTPDLVLEQYAWDSLAIVSTIALVDDLYGAILSGESLGKCVTVADILTLIDASKKAA